MSRAGPLLAAALAFCLCSMAAANNQTYPSLLPAKYAIALSYKVDGVTSAPDPCIEFNPANSTCMPKLDITRGDSVIITYSLNTTAGGLLNSTNTIKLTACYSNTSSLNRPWRKANPIIHKDKKCTVKITAGLPAGQGSFTWAPKERAAASYQIQLLEVAPDGATYTNVAKSKGYFEVLHTESRPTWLMALVSVFCTLGPITLVTFFVVEARMKKSK